MKRITALALAALMLAALLCACSATGNIDPYGGYSNVSTTRDGRVNGTNDRYYNGGYANGYGNGSGTNGYHTYNGGYQYGQNGNYGTGYYGNGYQSGSSANTAGSGSMPSAQSSTNR